MNNFPQCSQGRHAVVMSAEDVIDHLQMLQKEKETEVTRIDMPDNLDEAFKRIHERKILSEEVLVLRPDQVKRVRAFIHDLRSEK